MPRRQGEEKKKKKDLVDVPEVAKINSKGGGGGEVRKRR